MSSIDKLLFRIKPVIIIKRSAFFDKDWYKETYGVNDDPAAHYLSEGWKKNYNPSLKFSSKDYLINNPDIRDVNPLLHYEVFGKYEGRRPFVPRIASHNDYDLDDLDFPVDEYLERIEEKEIISFDVFDTLVIRPFVKAEEVFAYLEKEYGIEGFSAKRIEAERNARNVLNKEVNLDEIYDFIAEDFKFIKEKEIEFEITGCHLNPMIRPLYEKAREANKRVIAVSDMYLGKDIVKQILSNSSYEMDEIYVSCDYDKTKGSGELFDLVVEKENVSREGMLHFGDNYISDYSEPVGKGIESYQTPKITDSFLSDKKNNCFLSFLKRRSSLAVSLYLSQIAEYSYRDNDDSFFTELGYCFGGPLAMGYLKYLCKRAEELKIDLLLFVSRDGYSLKDLYERYFFDGIRIESKYAYLSRACIYSGSIVNKLTKDIKTILSIARIFIPEIEVCETREENINEYEKHKKVINEWSIKQSKYLEKHLEEISAGHQKIATVDMFSGNYTSQKGAQYYLKDRIATGFYAGNFADSHLIHDTYGNRLLGMRDNLPVKISEFLISSYESPICGVDESGKPVYEYEENKNKTAQYELTMRGIYKYFEDFHRFIDFDERFMLSLDEWFDLLDSFITECDEETVMHLSEVIDSENPVAGNNDQSIASLINEYWNRGY